MRAFDDITQQLQGRQPLPPLYPTQPWNQDLTQRIQTVSATELAGADVAPAQPEMLDACRAGLLLWNDNLEVSHTIMQRLENQTGSCWYAIMHRREGDASNSQYWWRRTGAHPAFGAIHEAVLAALQDEAAPAAQAFKAKLQSAKTWLPVEFVTCCESAQCDQSGSEWLQQVQVVEMATLLHWCREQLR